MTTEGTPKLTKWQQRRRERASTERRVMTLLFAALVAAAVVYFGALTGIIAPVFTEPPVSTD